MAPRARTRYRCTECGHVAAVWNGRCHGCDGWNTLEAERDAPRDRPRAGAPGPAALVDSDPSGATARSVGVDEVDRVLSGGLVPGSVTLLSGPPGVGKSTLSLQMAAGIAALPAAGSPREAGRDPVPDPPPDPVLYVSAEETVAQVRRRADRLGLALPAHLLVTDDPDVDAIAGVIGTLRPATVIVDSIQAVADPSVDSAPGSVAQVRGSAQRLAAAARATSTSLVVIGHVTKDGSIAGPRLLEHLVDTVVTFDADLDHGLRFLRAVKHRFGSVGELGVFTMESDGLVGVPDVAGLFLRGRRTGVPGSVVLPVLEGRRSLVVEVQALVEATVPAGASGVRVCQGVPRSRVELIRAVLDRHLGVTGDVYVSVAGGFEVTEPAGDLAIALALVSAALGAPLDASTVVCGELGLVGEVRGIAALERRLGEIARLGFTRAIVPGVTPADVEVPGVTLHRVDDLSSAVEACFGPIGFIGGGSSTSATGRSTVTLVR